MRLLSLLTCAFAAEDYPSYNFCRVFDPRDYEKIIPDMGLQNAWPKNDGINPDYQDKGGFSKRATFTTEVTSNKGISREIVQLGF